MNFIGIKPEASKASAAPRELNAVARAIAAEPVANAISPVVLIGLVRLAEFLGVAAIGTATYTAYVYPYDEPTLFYGVGHPVDLGRRGARIPGFRNLQHRRIPLPYQLTRLALAWTLVFLVAFAIS